MLRAERQHALLMNRRDRSKLPCSSGVELDSDKAGSSIEDPNRLVASFVPGCDREVI